MDLTDVTPVVLTQDEEANVERTLARLTWAREVVVVDSGSTDGTVSLARRFPNVRLLTHPMTSHASQWAFAVEQATTEWVLTLDADYVVPDDFVRELLCLDASPAVAYEAQFIYAVAGRPLRRSLYPPRLVMLRRGRCTFWQDGHTQRVLVEGAIQRLSTAIIHDDRKGFGRFLERQQRYMRQEAAKLRTLSWAELSTTGLIRRLIVVAPLAAPLHALLVRRLLLEGRPGVRYAFERCVAELVLSRELLRRSSGSPIDD